MKCTRCKGKGKIPVFWCGAEVEQKCPVCLGTGNLLNPKGLFKY
jgi:DnaJ-class molecular chaperone